MWINWNPHILLVGTENGAATLGNSLAVSQKVKQVFFFNEIFVVESITYILLSPH